MGDLISRSAIHNKICKHFNIPKDWDGDIAEPLQTVLDLIENEECAYDVDAVVEEVEKLDLDGISMVEDGKYKLIRKKEAISLIQTNGICKGRYKTCAECYKKDCPLSTEKTITDKWSDEVRKGGVNENNN